MPAALSTSAPTRPAPARAGRMLFVAVAAGALGLVGYDAWWWLFPGDALGRLTGVHVDAELRLRVRLVPVAPSAPAQSAGRGQPTLSLTLVHPA